MGSLLLAVFVASLAGSLHCAGMCGGLVAFVVAADSPKIGTQLIYHFSRAVTYVLLGGIAGLLGAAIDFSGDALGLGRAAVLLAGGTMVLFGLIATLRNLGVRLPIPPMPKIMTQAFARGHRLAAGRGPFLRAGLVGGLTAALPCGWLYAFVLTAASTSHPAFGALVMLVFWAGTVPILLGLGWGVQQLAAPLARRLPLVAPLVLVAVGLIALTGRFTPPTFAGKVPIASNPEQVKSLAEQTPPCCDDTSTADE